MSTSKIILGYRIADKDKFAVDRKKFKFNDFGVGIDDIDYYRVQTDEQNEKDVRGILEPLKSEYTEEEFNDIIKGYMMFIETQLNLLKKLDDKFDEFRSQEFDKELNLINQWFVFPKGCHYSIVVNWFNAQSKFSNFY